jgi:hypothetical protein
MEQQAMSDPASGKVTRRDFMKIVLFTVSAAILAKPKSLWPEDERDRPVEEPMVLERDGSWYLADPSIDESYLPTWRVHLGYDSKDEAGKKEALRELAETIHGESVDDWTVDESDLDDTIDPERVSMHALASCGVWGTALDLYDSLTSEENERLGLEYVEGDSPGSSFAAVAFSGDLADLNRDLEAMGMNLVVREE